MLEEGVVHFPVRLGAGLGRDTFRRLGRVQGVLMDLCQRKVAKHESEPLSELLLECQHHRMSPVTVRTLKVSVLHQRDWGIFGTLTVIGLMDWGSKSAHFASVARLACMASSASRMPSAPGFTPTGEQ